MVYTMGMRTIRLTRGQVAIVDDTDYEELSRYEWRADWNPSAKSYRAVKDALNIRTGRRAIDYMDRYIIGLGRRDRREVSHANGNLLDSRRENIKAIWGDHAPSST